MCFKSKGIKIGKNVLYSVFLFALLRLILWGASSAFGTQPFLCYDDLNIYDKISGLSSREIMHWFTFRNCFYFVCNIFNNIRLGEYLTGTRILNVFLWFFTCFKIKGICELLGYERKISNTIFRFFMISPLYVIYSLSALREVICAWGVCCLLYAFLRYDKEGSINWVTTISMTIILFFTRTGIVEILGVVILAYILREGKWYVKSLLAIAVIVAIIVFFRSENYIYVVNNKVTAYLQSDSTLTGKLSFIEVRSFKDIYKFILLIPYVQMIPLPGAFETFYTFNSWSAWVTLFSGISAFFLPFFWIFVFKSKKSSAEKVILLFYLVMTILLSMIQPNNSRFFFFATPIYYMFGIKCFIDNTRNKPNNVLLGVLFAVVPYAYLLI